MHKNKKPISRVARSNSNQAGGQCDEGVMTVTEARKFLKVSRSYLYTLMNSGRLPYTPYGERARRIPVKALIDFLENHTIYGNTSGH